MLVSHMETHIYIYVYKIYIYMIYIHPPTIGFILLGGDFNTFFFCPLGLWPGYGPVMAHLRHVQTLILNGWPPPQRGRAEIPSWRWMDVDGGLGGWSQGNPKIFSFFVGGFTMGLMMDRQVKIFLPLKIVGFFFGMYTGIWASFLGGWMDISLFRPEANECDFSDFSLHDLVATSPKSQWRLSSMGESSM